MADTAYETGVESPKDFGTTVAYWDAELRSSERTLDKWSDEARRIYERYTLEKRTQRQINSGFEAGGNFNILWSNVQTMLPSVYGQEPEPVVQRRYRDSDPIARLASMTLERAIKTDMESDERYGCSMDEALGNAALDLLLSARGVAWVRYDMKEANGKMVSERSPVEFLNRRNFLHSPKATWAEVAKEGWVARKTSLTRAAGVKRFGKVFNMVSLKVVGQGRDRDMSEKDMEVVGEAEVWEIWDARTRKVYWINRDYQDKVLDEKDDPLSLDGFFPCPMPAFGTVGLEDLIPVPDYKQYVALAEELDLQTERIDELAYSFKASGFYDASLTGIGQLLADDGVRNKLIPVENLAQFTAKGSTGGTITNVIQYLPLDTIAKALIGLYDARERTKQTLYEVSGIADILRGSVDPREKLGQSRIKESHAGKRIDSRMRAMEKLSVGVIRKKAEIIAEHYSPETIRAISGFDQLPQIDKLRQSGVEGQMLADQAFNAVIKLLRDEKLRGFRIEIETRSTALPNDDDEKQRRTEFLEATGGFLQNALPIAQAVPQMQPLIGEMLLFAVRGFRAGRQLETHFEEAVAELREQGGQPVPQEGEGDGGAQAAAESEAAQATAAAGAQAAQAQSAAKIMETQAKAAATQAKAEADVQKAQVDMMMTEVEMQAKLIEIGAELQKMQEEQRIREREALVSVATSGQGEGNE